MIILELLINNIPSPETFNNKNELYWYKWIVKMVSNGNKNEFNNFINRYKDIFIKEDVFHLILKLKGIVLWNQLKWLSVAYT